MFNIITRRTLLEYCDSYPQARTALLEWYHQCNSNNFKNFNELKKTFSTASIVGDDRVVFNIMGNHYRLITRIVFEYKTVQIKWFGTHNEYDKIDALTIQYKK